jgi:hypothetical protein
MATSHMAAAKGEGRFGACDPRGANCDGQDLQNSVEIMHDRNSQFVLARRNDRRSHKP